VERVDSGLLSEAEVEAYAVLRLKVVVAATAAILGLQERNRAGVERRLRPVQLRRVESIVK